MRVRYGKPIKVKSLLGKQNISTALSPTASWQAFGYKNNGGFILGGGATEKYLNIDNTHKYFICDYFDSANITTSALILYSYSPDAESSKESTYGTAQYYESDFACGIFSQLKHSGRANLSFRVSSTNINIDLTIKYSIILDLTEIGLDNLTAQQFYNKYNKYFPLIATGEEITIDDKAGQVSLKEKNSNNTISCKVAGGSSDIYYGYNQLIRSGDFTDMSEWTQYNCNIETVEDGYIKLITTAKNGRILQYPNHGGYALRTDHLYLIHLDVKDIDGKFSMAGFEYLELSIGTNYLIKHGNGNTFINIYGGYDRVGTYIIMKNLFIIDLTDWFGAGKEPTTAQEFYSMFTKSLYGECISPIKLTRYQIEALPTYGYNQYAKNGDLVDPAGWGGHGGSSIAVSDSVATITASTSSIANFGISRGIDAMTVGHKIFASCTARIVSGSSWVRLRFPALIAGPDLTSDFQVIEKIGTVENSAPGALLWQCVGTGNSAVVQFKNIYIIDLTEWYGEGNEPTTVEEFKQTFPNKYYPYSKKRLLNKYMINKLEN